LTDISCSLSTESYPRHGTTGDEHRKPVGYKLLAILWLRQVFGYFDGFCQTRFVTEGLRCVGVSSLGPKVITQTLLCNWNRSWTAPNFGWSRREYRQIVLSRRGTVGRITTGRVLNRHLATEPCFF